MKSAKSILDHLYHQPTHSKLLALSCFDKIKKALPLHIQKGIAFIYRKDRTLFFVLQHPGLKMELDYKHNLIKSLLTKIKEFDKNCTDIEIDSIKSFVTNKKPLTPPKKKSHYRYPERSQGSFQIETQNPKLKALFEAIQDEINHAQKPT